MFDEWIEAVLFAPWVVALTLIVGGVLLWWLEIWQKRRADSGVRVDRAIQEMGTRDAWWIGLFQCLALIPGTSRSGSTIAGALVCGYSRTAAAEFSFLVGLPILYGAAALKLGKVRTNARPSPATPTHIAGSEVKDHPLFVGAGNADHDLVRLFLRHQD